VIGTDQGIRVYDLPGKKFIDRYEVPTLEGKKISKLPTSVGCISLVFSKDQQYLYAGFTDGIIRVL